MDKSKKSELDIETMIHSLLVNGLDEARRREILQLIARETNARELLAEMLVFQTDARRTFGCDGIDEAASASLANVKEMFRNHAGTGRKTVLRRILTGSFLLRVAAVVVVALSVYLAVCYHNDYKSINEKLAKLENKAAVPELTEEEVNNFRSLWNEIADNDKGVRPWAMLNDDSGKFGYIQVSDGDRNQGQVVLLRCILLTSDGKNYRQINLLLPADEDIRLSVPDAVVAGGTPINCKVTTGDNWAMVDLIADKNKPEKMISGSVNIGREPVGIGELSVNGEKLHVVLHAVRLNGVAG